MKSVVIHHDTPSLCINNCELCIVNCVINVNLGVAGAPGAGGFPFSLYSNHFSGTGHLYNPKDDL